MELILILLKYIIPLWLILVFIMLPTFFVRKKKAPSDEKNTFKALLIKSLLVSIIFVAVFGSGLIAMYFDEISGVYK